MPHGLGLDVSRVTQVLKVVTQLTRSQGRGLGCHIEGRVKREMSVVVIYEDHICPEPLLGCDQRPLDGVAECFDAQNKRFRHNRSLADLGDQHPHMPRSARANDSAQGVDG